MSREILFKAKRIDNGEWVEGYYLYCKGATTVSFQNEHYILVFDGFGVAWHEVDRDTLCQYTGLTDKNGNKIWENDVVLKSDVNPLGWNRTRNCKVLFTNSGYWSLLTEYGDGYGVGEFEREQLEVVGNIFDNPELLRGEDDENG